MIAAVATRATCRRVAFRPDVRALRARLARFLAGAVALLALLNLSAIPAVRAAEPAVPVARVTLVAGAAERVDARDVATPLAPDAPIHVGDRVRTGVGGLLHLRFVDGAHVGLREKSELKVVAYRAEPAAIQFELTRGAVRQISGAIAQRRPEAFRLNTPIAAIGVRGTDFVTGAVADRTFALLLEGAITVGARQCEGECRPALVDRPQTLATIDMRGQVSTRQVLPAEIERIVGAQRLAQGPLAPSAEPPVRDQVAVDRLQPLPDAPPPVESGPAGLLWARWLAIGRLPESFAMESAAMAALPDYKMRATNLSYSLWRHEPAGSQWTAGGGTLELGLHQAAARYTNGYMSLPVVVESGTLSLDLAHQGFATRLTGRLQDAPPRGLESLAVSQTLLDLRGQIDAEGRLFGNDRNALVNGAIALDKTGAGYLFTSDAAFGKIEGITTWRR